MEASRTVQLERAQELEQEPAGVIFEATSPARGLREVLASAARDKDHLKAPAEPARLNYPRKDREVALRSDQRRRLCKGVYSSGPAGLSRELAAVGTPG